MVVVIVVVVHSCSIVYTCTCRFAIYLRIVITKSCVIIEWKTMFLWHDLWSVWSSNRV